jgi:hypothetical protein
VAKGYWIVRVDVKNEGGMKPYAAASPAIYKKFGGRPAFTTNVTRIKVHRRPVPFSECLIRPLHYGCVGLRHPYAYQS